MACAAWFGDWFAGSRPATLGAAPLAPCPGSPNCVSSSASDVRHAIAPIAFSGPPEPALERLVAVAAAQPGARLITHRPDYAHLEFVSARMGFVDDVEFRVQDAPGRIEVRSASRLGYSDLGANRRRIESIRRAFEQAPAR